MGRSFPSFAHDDCSLLSNGNFPPEFLNTDFGDEESVRRRLFPYKGRVSSCWMCTDCDFVYSGVEQPNNEFFSDDDDSEESLDDDGKVPAETNSNNFLQDSFDKEDLNITDTLDFHFLQYSGTKQLVEDIERIRILFNAPRMHVLGVSYGTSVFGAYASIFPNSVGLMVLDSTIHPFPNLYDKARSGAIGQNERLNYLAYSCGARNVIADEDSCPVDDMRKCIGDTIALMEDVSGFSAGSPESVSVIQELIGALYETNTAEEICNAAAAKALDRFESLVGVTLGGEDGDGGGGDGLGPASASTNPAAGQRNSEDIEISPSKPTLASDVLDNPNYEALMTTELPLTMVRAQDNVAEGAYDEYFFAKEIVEFNSKYTGAGTGVPAAYFFNLWSHAFYWPPNTTPLPPIGNPYVTGIISGSLYDSITPYKWTQNMRSQFKLTHLLTSQTINHGLLFLDGGDVPCNEHIIRYFELGYPAFVDGTICGSGEFATNQDFLDAFEVEA